MRGSPERRVSHVFRGRHQLALHQEHSTRGLPKMSLAAVATLSQTKRGLSTNGSLVTPYTQPGLPIHSQLAGRRQKITHGILVPEPDRSTLDPQDNILFVY
jgi:hypothetical protein